MKRKQGTELPADNSTSMAVTAYLIMYNVLQCTGWSVIGCLLLIHIAIGNSSAVTYESVSLLLKIFQFSALLEVLHAMFGMVRSSAMITLMQVMSRVYVLFILAGITQTQSSFGVMLLMVAWTISEIIRYSFYTMSILGNVPYTILWLRYTLFIGLYPIGVTGELLVQYSSLWHSDRISWLQLELPNAANISFSLAYLTAAIMILYIPFFPLLYMHMLRQRRKIIGGMRTKGD